MSENETKLKISVITEGRAKLKDLGTTAKTVEGNLTGIGSTAKEQAELASSSFSKANSDIASATGDILAHQQQMIAAIQELKKELRAGPEFDWFDKTIELIKVISKNCIAVRYSGAISLFSVPSGRMYHRAVA